MVCLFLFIFLAFTATCLESSCLDDDCNRPLISDNLTIAEEAHWLLNSVIKVAEPTSEVKERIIRESVALYRRHVNTAFLDYRKTVSTDYTAIEWRDGGNHFQDISGRRYLDILGGFGIYNVGHRHPRVMEAVIDQLKKQALHSQDMVDPLRSYLCHLLTRLVGHGLEFVFLTNSGTESVEATLKAAMLSTGRSKFVGALGAFHGKSLGSLGGTSKSAFRHPFEHALGRWQHIPFGDLKALEVVLASGNFTGEQIAGVILEPVQGEGGIHVAPPGYLRGVRELCTRFGAMMILDEVQTGMGRTGKMFAFELEEGVSPDLIALGKGLGGGIQPIGAAIGTRKVWERFNENPVLHTTTFGGNPLACAAAIATISVILDENLCEQARTKGLYLKQGMQNLLPHFPSILIDVRGVGLMLGMEFSTNEIGFAVDKELFRGGILISGTLVNSKVLRVEPPMTITKAEMDFFLSVLHDSLHAVQLQLLKSSGLDE